MPKTPKVKQRTKEELLAAQKATDEVKRKRRLAKDLFYPLLLNNTKSIEDSKNFCSALSITIRQAFNKEMNSRKIESFGIRAMIDPKAPEATRYLLAFEMLQDETVKDALEIVEGMSTAIDGFQREEATNRPLSELKTEFLE